MTSVEHQATVDRGLKMKIKRKNIGAKSDSKHEIVKSGENKTSLSQTNSNTNGIMVEKSKAPCEKDRSPKSKVLYNKKEKTRDKIVKSDTNVSASSIGNGLDITMGQIPMEPRIGETPVKKENPMPDPYEFNAKVEDGIAVNPIKKIKVEKVDTVSSPVHQSCSHTSSDTGTEMCTVGVNTQPECLGPCEPGTSVMLEGIVWNETENGVLVVNVTWRGKTYVGTLLDATKHDWAPPRFSCDSPVSDFETRTPKGRGKRGRAAANTPVLERGIIEGRKLRKGRRGSSISTFQAPPSPAKSDISTSSGVKRKGRPADIDLSSVEVNRPNKRSRSSSRGTPGTESPPALIQCPEPNCNKKYKHINGLRYHQSHAHQGSVFLNTDGDEDMKDVDSVDDCVENVDSNKKEQTECVISTSAESKTKKNSASVSKTTTQRQDTPEKLQSKPEQNKEDISNISKPEEEYVINKKDITSLCTSAVTNTITSVSPKISVPVPQLYQITAAPIACLGGVTVVSQATNPGLTSTSPTTSNSTHVVATVPITVTAVTTTLPQTVDLKTDNGKSEKNADRIKSKTSSARPIVPAPSPQMIALTSNVTVTSSTLAPVTTHTPVSPQLKPIQPKPTIMGDPTSVNPALASLKDNKKSKPKKKPKEKETNTGNFINNAKTISKDETQKCDRPAVIKSVPSPGKPVIDRNVKKDISIVDNSRAVCEIPKPFTASASNLPHNQKGMDLSQQSRTLPPPNMLKVGSPLQVLTPDNRKTPVTDDVQSPAYSDISDANESGSPGQTESPHKHKEENTSKKEERERVAPRPQQQETSAMSSPYGMYAYYGQSPYFGQSPNIPQSQISKGSTKPQTVTKEITPPTHSSEEKKQPPEERKTPIEKLPQTPGKEENKPKQDPTTSQTAVSQQQMQEYQQKWLQHMYALQALPPHAQYQYLAAYGYVDPSYHMQLYASDPQYRQHHEKLMEEQQKRQQEHSKLENEPGKLHEVPGQSVEGRAHSADSGAVTQVTPSKGVVMHSGTEKLVDHKKSAEKSEKDIREQTLKEKQNETHQILKENIDLKAQMDNKSRYENEHYRNIRDKQAEDLRRLEMFQHQKLIEQQKRNCVSKSERDITPRNLTTTKTPDSAKSHSFQDQPRDLARKDSANIGSKTKEPNHSRDSSESKIHSHVESKMTEEKLSRNPSSGEKRKTVESSKSSINKPFTPSKTVSPSNPSGNVNVSGSSGAQPSPVQVGPYSGNYMAYPYMQSPPYGHFDPNMYRGMNPSMMYGGYSYSPQHMGYRVSNEVEEKDKTISATPQKQCSDPDVKSQSDMVHNSQYYGSGHKIHELEKTRPSSHSSSPLPTKSVDPPPKPSTPSGGFEKRGQDYTSSPPTQRHVHTHHHTHVVGGYPMYDPYGAVYASGASQQSPSVQPPFLPE